MQQWNLQAGAGGSQMSRAVAVDCKREFRLLLRLVHGGVGGGIDDNLRVAGGQRPIHRGGVRDIQFGHIPGQRLMAKRRRAPGQFPAHLAPGPDYQNSHGLTLVQ